jgi:putative tryptophan/tyrosine transport system substrate-binding protein
MKKGAVLSILVAVVLLAVAVIAEAQQPKKIPRIGYLATRSGPGPNDQAFQQGLRELGYVEGQNIVIERRWAGNLDRLPSLAAELVSLKVDIIVTSGSTSTRAAKQATVTIPIVMAQDPDPIGNGFIASLARPEGNVTGLSNLNRELSGKRLELLKEIIPRLSRLAVFGTTAFPGNAQGLREVEAAAGAFGIKLQSFDCLSPNDIETAFRAASRERANAVLVLPGPVFNSHQTKIAELAVKHRLPATYNSPEYVEGGGLMSYGASIPDSYRRAATYVDKILKGAKPADLPVEQPTKFEFIINLKAAKQIGLTIPPNVLVRADKVNK